MGFGREDRPRAGVGVVRPGPALPANKFAGSSDPGWYIARLQRAEPWQHKAAGGLHPTLSAKARKGWGTPGFWGVRVGRKAPGPSGTWVAGVDSP